MGKDERTWWRARTDYIAGRGSMAQVAERYGVGISALKRRAAAEMWVEQRAKMALDVTAAVLGNAQKAEIEIEQSRQERLSRIWDNLIGQLERCVIDQEASESVDRQGLKSLVSIFRELQAVQFPETDKRRIIIIDDILE